jgi:flagellin
MKMVMGVNTNISSLSAQRALVSAERSLETAMERLSSGKRINSAADDAAGLAIAERMNAQVSGLNMAVRNANDGIALSEAVEGSLVEIGDMLQRMRELAVQAASETLTNTDRNLVEKEFDALSAEITRISTTTTFNDQKILDGTLSSKLIQVGPGKSETVSITVDNAAASALGAYTYVKDPIAALAGTNAAGIANSQTAAEDIAINGNGVTKTTSASNAAGATTDILGSAKEVASQVNAFTGDTGVTAEARTGLKIFDPTAALTTHTLSVAKAGDADDLVNVGSFQISASDVSQGVAAINAHSAETGVVATAGITAASQHYILLRDADGDDIVIQQTHGTTDTLDVEPEKFDGTFGSKVDVGDSADATDMVRQRGVINFSSSDSFSLTTAGTAGKTYIAATSSSTISSIGSASLTTVTNANAAITSIDGAIAKVAEMRGDLGAITNRLSHAATNLMTVAEKTAGAVARVEDADFSVESANLAKAQVLMQVGTAMLAQANAQPQLVMQLLQ